MPAVHNYPNRRSRASDTRSRCAAPGSPAGCGAQLKFNFGRRTRAPEPYA
jgi:hypothetical protein